MKKLCSLDKILSNFILMIIVNIIINVTSVTSVSPVEFNVSGDTLKLYIFLSILCSVALISIKQCLYAVLIYILNINI